VGSTLKNYEKKVTESSASDRSDDPDIIGTQEGMPVGENNKNPYDSITD
jgi:hypothetical protein